jgi:D-amino-acid dehydrogenase
MMSREALLQQGLGASLAHWAWIARSWRAGRAEVCARNRQAVFELTRYSQQRLGELRQRLGLDYERSEGLLVLLRGERDRSAIEPQLEVLRQTGVRHHLLTAEQCRAMEPDLSPTEPLAGALHLPDDEAGNCRQVAHLLRDLAETRHNVRFRYRTNVTGLSAAGGRPRLWTEPVPQATQFGDTPSGSGARRSRPAADAGPKAKASEEEFDAVVVCAGVDAAVLLRRVGLRLPILPVHGYSATFALRIREVGPRLAMVDEHYKVTITRLGPRVRVSGGVELGGDGKAMRQPALETLYKVAQDWLPGMLQFQVPQLWKGARPTLPDGPPMVGASGAPNIWLNVGHGGSGWALACGSARLLADQLAQRTPALDGAPFSVQRMR